MKTLKDYQNYSIDFESLGGREIPVADLVTEIISNRRRKFWNIIFSLSDGETSAMHIFDGIGFKAATSDFSHNFIRDAENFEGSVEYEVIVGNDWVWHCKTDITWKSLFPVAFGGFIYHTEVVANKNVKECRIHAMNGTSLYIKVIKKDLKAVSILETYQRDIDSHR